MERSFKRIMGGKLFINPNKYDYIVTVQYKRAVLYALLLILFSAVVILSSVVSITMFLTLAMLEVILALLVDYRRTRNLNNISFDNIEANLDKFSYYNKINLKDIQYVIAHKDNLIIHYTTNGKDDNGIVSFGRFNKQSLRKTVDKFKSIGVTVNE